MRTNRTRNLRTENTIQLKILEKKHLPAQMHWEERKMTQRSGKNSCSSNQDQMFNAVQWGTNSQHINSFMLCRVVCVPDVVAFCACVFFFSKRMQRFAIAPPLTLTSSEFKSASMQRYVFSTLLFFCSIRYGPTQWPMRTNVGRKSEFEKKMRKNTFLSHESSERPFAQMNTTRESIK